ncbi:amidohydrolase family protein [Rhodococcus wratislaviensis]|uniref:amidohydrolase family protein n=1 Tax=Rhodococcus wratislaviensis TaxID=44752 RepID=UPI000F564F38|nr:amidohydrolase family protein [Rhodococcus wratislaviensis]
MTQDDEFSSEFSLATFQEERAMSAVKYAGGFLVTQDPKLGDFYGDLLIEDGRISQVGRNIEADVPTVDATNKVLIPGFVDTHRHMWETAIRGVSAWQDWEAYARVVRSGYGGLVTPEDVYAGDLLGALGALESGITTVRDESHVQNSPEHTEAVLQGLVDAGGRAVLAYGWPSVDTYAWRERTGSRRHPRYITEVLERGNTAGGGLVSFALMVRGPDLSGLDATRDDLAFARSLGLRSSMHIGGRKGGIAALADNGLLGDDLLYIHACESTDDEFAMIADSGGTASVSAYIELAMGIGRPATGRLLAAGVRPSFSIDAEPSAPADMFSVMRAALMGQMLDEVRGVARPAEKFTEREVLSFATYEGARACGLEHELGSLTPGKAADVVVMDLHQAGMASSNEPISAIINQGHPGAVVDVLVAGRYVKKDGRMCDQALVDRAILVAEQSRDRLHSKFAELHAS